jgi:hypothetical protein
MQKKIVECWLLGIKDERRIRQEYGVNIETVATV